MARRRPPHSREENQCSLLVEIRGLEAYDSDKRRAAPVMPDQRPLGAQAMRGERLRLDIPDGIDPLGVAQAASLLTASLRRTGACERASIRICGSTERHAYGLTVGAGGRAVKSPPGDAHLNESSTPGKDCDSSAAMPPDKGMDPQCPTTS